MNVGTTVHTSSAAPASASAPARPTSLGAGHPLAQIAAGHCDGHTAPLLGGVACGACWERAIRDDERVVVQFALPRELTPDPSYVDQVAVDRACEGEHLALTEAELVAAIHQLRRRGATMQDIAARLRAPDRLVFRETAGTPRGGSASRQRGGGAAA
jgi:hypothetical protein